MSSYLIKPELSSAYPVVSYAKGSYVYDQTGKKYLDGSSGAVTCNIGHGVRDVTEKLKEQLDQVSFAYRSQFTSEPAEQLAALLAQELPGDVNWFFCQQRIRSDRNSYENRHSVLAGKKANTKIHLFVSMEQLPRNNFGSAFIVWFL